ncbi:IPT/TIG domain-containing protein [Spirosoma sp. KNUC1025]|uniref:IPT/TIG domain-containing protein n=1 Tax=Spirosoma sp. KNUC1025 TaxID=2894082 RepID=UPI00386495F7|nr:IPT/TIG domain-containing protein [Spirosoma sp. KNUC1025]
MKSLIPLFFLFIFFLGESGCRIQSNPPELISLSVREANVGDEITLVGHQFGASPVVLFGTGTSAISASIVNNDDNTIKVKVPYITPGSTLIRVQTDQGTTDPLPFIARQPGPVVATISPTNGLPGTSVVITGDFLNQIKQVRFGNVAAAIQDSVAQKLTVTVPPNVGRGPVILSIETKGGFINTNFIVAGTPQITSLSPLQTKPGAQLVIKGMNLTDGQVRVNGKPTDKALTTVTDTEIRTVIPAEATTGRVTVTVFEKLVATSTDTVQIFQAPVVARLSAQDAIGGDKVIIEGRNLAAVTNVMFGNFIATFRVLSDTQLEAVVPSPVASGPVVISVSSLGGSGSGVESLFVYLPPSSVTVTPPRQLPGRFVTISGKDFYRISDVRFNNVSIPIVDRVEGSSVYISLPANAVSGPVTITNRAGSGVSAVPLVIIQPAVVTGVTPASAKVGQRVVIRGDYLQDAQILFTGSAKAAADDGKNTDTERWVLVPADAKTGPIRITNATTTITETTSFTVVP